MSVFPYVYYKDSELASLSKKLSARLAGWSKDWCHKGDAANLVRIIPFDINDYVYGKQTMLIHVMISDGKWVDCWVKTSAIRRITAELSGIAEPANNLNNRHNEPGKMERSMVIIAIEALVTSICGEDIVNVNSSVRSEVIDHHYLTTKNTAIGKLKMTMRIANENVDLMVSPLLSHALVGRKYNMVNGAKFYDGKLEKLVLKKKVPYEVSLGTVDILVEELVSLQVGDVIKLDKKLNDYCGIVFDRNQGSYKCTLGRVDGSKAIRIDGLKRT